MRVFIQKMADKYQYLRGFFPKKLPVGVAEFNNYCDNLFRVYGIPDMPSYRMAIASMVMHLSPTTFHKAPYFFVVSVRKAQANQIAYEIIQQLKQKEAEVKQGEDAPIKGAPPDESVSQQAVQSTAN